MCIMTVYAWGRASRSPGDELARGNPFIPRKLTDYSGNILYSLKYLLFFYYSGNNFLKPTLVDPKWTFNFL